MYLPTKTFHDLSTWPMDTLRLLFVPGQCMKNVNLFISLVSIYKAKGYSSSSFQRFCWQKNCKPNQKRCLCNLNAEVPQGKSNFLLKPLQCPASLTPKGMRTGKKWIFSIFLGSYRFLSLLGYDHSLKVPSQGCVTKTNVNRPLYGRPALLHQGVVSALVLQSYGQFGCPKVMAALQNAF
jgi:hypothetical protein